MYWLVHGVAVTKCLTKSPREEELILVHGVSGEPITVEREWHAGWEASGYIGTEVQEQKESNADAQMCFFFPLIFFSFLPFSVWDLYLYVSNIDIQG